MERLDGGDLEFEAAIGTWKDLSFDEVLLLDRPTAIGTFDH